MSTRWYPIYVRGNPQLRVFLPNFWMRLVRNKDSIRPPNVVHFEVSSQMTQLDVKNYLERIYKIPVMDVKTLNLSGKTYNVRNEVIKDDDVKLAIVTLPTSTRFKFPEVTGLAEEAKKYVKSKSELQQVKANYQKVSGIAAGTRRGAPSFFGL